MSSEIAIKVDGLSKCYHVYDKPRDRLFQMLLHGYKQFYREFWALKNISFEVEKGEIVGILGRNGAGKSTLLQILCGTLSPTSGTIEINGRIAALLELGSGFNPEFTGLENVYFNGGILGLSKEQIDNKLNEIKSFADIGDFFHQPVKTYSSGMFARLAFSVAVNVDPDILVVDEALSVGDAWFQHKSMARMKILMSQGCTVLFVSHSIDSVRSLCNKAIWLEGGMIKAQGKATDITNDYMNEVFIEHNKINLSSASTTPEIKEIAFSSTVSQESDLMNQIDLAAERLDGGNVIKVRFFRLVNSNKRIVDKLHQGERFAIEVGLEFIQNVKNISIGFLIKDQFGLELTGESVFNKYRHSLDGSAGQLVQINFESTMLLRGGQTYSVGLRVNQVSKWDRSDNLVIYVDDLAAVFDVITDPDNPMWFRFKQDFNVKVLYE